MNNKHKNTLLFTIFIIFILFFNMLIFSTKDSVKECTYKEFLNMVNKKQIEEIKIDFTEDQFTFISTNDKIYTTENPKYDNFKKDMLEKGIQVNEKNTIKFGQIFSIIFNIGLIVMLLMFVSSMKQMNGFGKISGKFSKPIEKNSNVNFKNVAGLIPVKKDLEVLVDFLKNPKKFTDAGAKLPKGVILYGPPGTGKTLLAKAIAGEANVAFFTANGSDFIEKYVGVGAGRVRELFENARKNSPCIIFIDELDAIGMSRNGMGENSEHRQTINELLAQMDGFDNNNGVLVIGATNRIDDLDTAFIRPGRFDSHIAVPIPETAKEREEIIKMYSENKKFSEDVDFKALSKETLGFSPADIEALMNESALISVQKEKSFIDKECIDMAVYKKILKGHQKEDSDRDISEIKLVAWHEAGHALIGSYYNEDIPKVTIIPSTSGAGGVTFFNPKKLGLYSLDELKYRIQISYGGRCAERVLLGNINRVTTGASSDIEKSTKLIYEIITKFGMSEKYGMLNLDVLKVKNETILDLACEMAKDLESSTFEILDRNKEILEDLANLLIEKETITGEELKLICKDLV